MIKRLGRLGRKSARLLMGATLLVVAAVVGMPTPASASATSEWGYFDFKEQPTQPTDVPHCGSRYRLVCLAE